jgi:hypothetical protein
MALMLLGSGPVRAQEDEGGSAYARIRFVESTLTIHRGAEADSISGTLNTPLVPGDAAWTDGGRAEIELADGSLLRLDEGTHVEVRSLSGVGRDERATLLALTQGTLRVDLRGALPSASAFQIDSLAGSVYLLSAGTFRLDADAGVTTVSSFRGVAEVSGDSGSVLVRSGERTSVRAGRSPAEPRHFNTLRQDDFDQFCAGRDAAFVEAPAESEPAPAAEEDLPPEVQPYARELSIYGAWHNVPTYGWVWRPTYYGSWGPYVDGHWTWCPTGWAWVSDDVWGWAPYHYGRWNFSVDLGWIWIPGRRWSGAWVSFAVGPSYVGWCPLDFYNRPVFHEVDYVSTVNVNVGRLDPRGWRFVPVSRFCDQGLQRTYLRGDRVPRGADVVVTRALPQFNPRAVAIRPEAGQQFMARVRAARAPVPVQMAPSGQPVPFHDMERGGRRGAPVGEPPARLGRSSAIRPERQAGAPGMVPPVRGMGARPGASPVAPMVGPGNDRGGQGASGPASQGRGGEPRRRWDAGATRGSPGGAAPRVPGASPSGAAPPGAPRVDRPRGHAVERLFDGARRPAPIMAPVPPPKPESHPAGAGSESKRKPETRREERPRRDQKRR